VSATDSEPSDVAGRPGAAAAEPRYERRRPTDELETLRAFEDRVRPIVSITTGEGSDSGMAETRRRRLQARCPQDHVVSVVYDW
jgi:hypothetical protein